MTDAEEWRQRENERGQQDRVQVTCLWPGIFLPKVYESLCAAGLATDVRFLRPKMLEEGRLRSYSLLWHVVPRNNVRDLLGSLLC